MKVCIVGASGKLGQYMVQHALDRGHEVVGVCREESVAKLTARVIGVIYLAGMVVGVGGNVLIQSILGAPDHLAGVPVNSMLLAIGAVLWLTAVAGDAAHGILMFPVLKRHSERIAFGYFGARIMDAVLVAVRNVMTPVPDGAHTSAMPVRMRPLVARPRLRSAGHGLGHGAPGEPAEGGRSS